MSELKICVVGLGFVGLTASTIIASKGLDVIGVETNSEKYEMIKQGKSPFFEPKIEQFLTSNLGKTFHISNNLKESFLKSDILFVCVGTPSQKDGSANLSFINQVCIEIGQSLRNENSFKVIIIKSTIPPLTCKNVVKPILEEESKNQVGKDFGLCMNPEFLREGSAIDDMLHPHLVVIGSDDDQTKQKMRKFYEMVYDSMPEYLETTWENAELIKYANNAFLATKISFINSVANVCSKIKGADVEIIAKAIGTDPRIGPLFLKAGPGFGGSCFPKDLAGFLSFSTSLGYEFSLLASTQQVNKRQVEIVIDMIYQKLNDVPDKIVSVLGLSFKKNTDDIRESVAIKVVDSLLQDNVKIKVHDPMAIVNFQKLFTDKISYSHTIQECLKNSSCCVILTDWDEYANLTKDDFISIMKIPKVVDARRVLDPKKMNSIDFSAIGYGL